MIFDALTLSAVVHELQKKIVGGRLERIAQVDTHTLLLTATTRERHHRLLLSIHPQFYRVHLVSQTYSQHKDEASFATTAREMCRNTLISSVSQPSMDRILILYLRKRSALLFADMKMIVELTGRMSNIILTQSENDDIVSAWRPVDASMCRYRQIIPGQTYTSPPPPPRLNPLRADVAQFEERLRQFHEEPLTDGLSHTLQSVGTRLAAYVIQQTGLRGTVPTSSVSTEQIHALWKRIRVLWQNVRDGVFMPLIFLDSHGRPVDIAPTHIECKNESCVSVASSMSQALEMCYSSAMESHIIETLRERIRTAITQKKHYWLRTRERIEDEYRKAQRYGEHRRIGEIIVANMNRLRRGMQQADVIDYFQPDQPTITIELDPERTPQENAKVHFRKAQKAQKSIAICQRRLREADTQLSLLNSLSGELKRSSNEESLQTIIKKAESTNLHIRPKHSSKAANTKGIPFRRFMTTSGRTVFIGRNNRENDRLTFQIAAPNDIWLHARGVAGSHVVLKREGDKTPLDHHALEEAAMLAAYYSKARSSAIVPVSYTERRNVKKPKGALPGMVIIAREKTILVEPKLLKGKNAGQKKNASEGTKD